MNDSCVFDLVASRLDDESFIVLSHSCSELRDLFRRYNRQENAWWHYKKQLALDYSHITFDRDVTDVIPRRSVLRALSRVRETRYKFTQEVLSSSRCTQLLLSTFRDDRQVDPSSPSQDPIILACQCGHIRSVKYLLLDAAEQKKRCLDLQESYTSANISARSGQAFVEACRAGRTEVVRLLLTLPEVDPTTRDNLGFICACLGTHIEVIKLLLSDPRIDPGAQENSAFASACSYREKEVMSLLLSDLRVQVSPERRSLALRCIGENSESSLTDLNRHIYRSGWEKQKTTGVTYIGVTKSVHDGDVIVGVISVHGCTGPLA